jgi:hypothetical protein
MTNLYAGDCRRAAALVVHYGTQNMPGVNEVLKEAVDVDRVSETVLGVLNLFEQVIPQLVTPLGIACMSDVVARLAEDEEADPDCSRAARIVTHHADKSVDGINIVMGEACDSDRVTPLILGVLHLYSTICPQIFTRLGLAALQQSVLDFAVQEGTE